MSNLFHADEKEALQEQDFLAANVHRRSFLKYAGAGAASMALLAAGCKKDHPAPDYTQNFGTGDIAILNYAYALEQLEAAFYIQVAATPYSGISAVESAYLTDIRDHEVAHREFFKAALGSSAIGALQVDFSKINFGDRTSVLGAAKSFEDLGVQAYNGAGYLIKNADYLTLAGKIVSVEARHAALIRDLISNGTFITDEIVPVSNAVEITKTPAEVLAIAGAYILTPLNTSGIPTS